MAEENEVAPQTAEENQIDEGIVSISDIANAAGLDSSIFDNASNDEPEEESAEEIEPVAEQEEPTEYREEPEESSEDTEGVKKRIGKLIEARNKAIEEAEELKAQLNKAREDQEEKRSTVEDKGLDRFDEITTLKELKQREEDAEHLREWLLENPEGGEYTDLSGDTHEVEYDQARQLTVATDRDLRKNIPKVAKRIVDRENNLKAALQTFDWMKDQTSPENIEIQQVLSQNAYINDYYKKDPFAVLTVGYAIEGIKAINAKKKAQQPTPAQAPRVPSAPSRATPSVVKGKRNKDKSLLQQAMSGEIDDAASYIESLL